MASTYTVVANGVTFALNKCMLGIFNGSGSGQIVRIWRIWILNNQTAAVTGVPLIIELRRTSAGSGGTVLTPVNHTGSATPASQIAIAANQTVTGTDLFRRIWWSNDEATGGVTAATIDEFETLLPFSCVWDTGVNDNIVQPIICRENQGIGLINITNTAVGNCDLVIEFTVDTI